MKKFLFILLSVFINSLSLAQVTVVNTSPKNANPDTSKNKTVTVKKIVKVTKPNSCSEVKYKLGMYYSKKDTNQLYTGDCEEYWNGGGLRAYYKYEKGTITFIQRFDQKGTCIEQWGTKKAIGEIFDQKQP